MPFDFTILTDKRYVAPRTPNGYVQNILTEDQLVKEALEKEGYKVHRTNWDDRNFDWNNTTHAIFRTTWDYFDRFDEFQTWLHTVNTKTRLVNDYELIKWNLDKHYLLNLQNRGITIPPTLYLNAKKHHSLINICKHTGWNKFVLKPAVSGAGRHTYAFDLKDASNYENIFRKLIQKENMLLQEFQQNVVDFGEIAMMYFGHQFSHAIIKKAKPGDFRVQDDFGGTVHPYTPSKEELLFCQKVIENITPKPVYCRIDLIKDNSNTLAVGELELIEPELWFRFNPKAANQFVKALQDQM